jgi:integrase
MKTLADPTRFERATFAFGERLAGVDPACFVEKILENRTDISALPLIPSTLLCYDLLEAARYLRAKSCWQRRWLVEKKKIGLREVRALEPGKVIYDLSVPGFAARRQQDGVSYVLRYRTQSGRQRWYTIGRHGAPWTPDEARERAMQLLGEVASGGDPAANKHETRHAQTISDLCDSYWSDVTQGRLLTRRGIPKKQSTLESDRGRIERHIRPILGRIPVKDLSRRDIEQFMHAVAEGKTSAKTKTGKKRGLSNVRGGQGVATRSVGLLGAILNYGIDRGLRNDNPAHRIQTFAENRRERRISDGEYAAIGKALREAVVLNIWPPALAVTRFLALTGWRSSEALCLRQDQIDLTRRTAALPDTKTGRSIRPISLAARDVILDLSMIGSNPLIFPASRGGGAMSGFRSIWDRILKLECLPSDITPHVLRHSFASVAADLGYSEPTIAALIGHKGRSITSRYVHSADAVLLGAADAVANHISDLLAGELRFAEVQKRSVLCWFRMSYRKLEVALREWAGATTSGTILKFDLAGQPLDPRIRYELTMLARLGPTGWRQFADDRPDETFKQISALNEQLIGVVACLKIANQNEHAIHALMKNGLVGPDSDSLYEILSQVERYVRKTSQALVEVQGSADGASDRKGRPRNLRANFITKRTGSLYTLLTGKRPTTSYPVENKARTSPLRRHSPFIDLLNSVFFVLQVHTSAGSRAATLIRSMQKNM